MIYLELFLSFLMIGFTSFGGMSMIPLINQEMLSHGWLTAREVADIVAIAEMTPGPIAINCATYVGYKQGKIAGAVSATLGMILPSFVIISLISRYLDRFLEIGWVAHAFAGVKIAVGILIVDAAVKLLKVLERKPFPITLVVCSSLAMILINIFSVRISPMILMLAAAGIGVLVFLIMRKAEEVKADK